eukprot:s2502_g12.t1
MHPQQKTEDHCYLACAGGANEAELALPRVLGHSGMLGQPRRNEQQAPTCGAALTEVPTKQSLHCHEFWATPACSDILKMERTEASTPRVGTLSS